MMDKVKEEDHVARLKLLNDLLFRNLYIRCAMGLLYEDRIVLALQLARIRYESEYDIPIGASNPKP